MEPSEHRVAHATDAFVVRRAAIELAGLCGFSRVECVEIAIAASELTTNIVKYGVRGRVRIEPVDDAARGPGIRVLAFDEGPPFRDFAEATRDGYGDDGPVNPSRLIGRGGIGAGLGAVLVTGGEDVDPSHYGGPADYPGRGQTFAEADRVQFDVVRGSVEARLPLVGIDNLPGAVPIEGHALARECVLVFGQEGPGLSAPAHEACDVVLSIAQFGSTRSVNAGVAAGIAMHAWVRQHADLDRP